MPVKEIIKNDAYTYLYILSNIFALDISAVSIFAPNIFAAIISQHNYLAIGIFVVKDKITKSKGGTLKKDIMKHEK